MMDKSPTEVLEAEHHIIQKVVGAMAVLAQMLEMGQEVEAKMLGDIVEFMRTFADKCHHGKEEVHLFPALERRGVPTRGCPVGALLHEHQQGRALVIELAQATGAYIKGEASAKEALQKSLRGLVELYPGHIWKEDYLLFPMTNKVLSPEDQQDLCEKFERVEEAIGRDVHRRLEQIAEEIESKTLTS
jgi:hemerythrin-like domain-containing protein